MWEGTARAWIDMTSSQRPPELAIADVYMLFQTLVGAWPLELSAADTARACRVSHPYRALVGEVAAGG